MNQLIEGRQTKRPPNRRKNGVLFDKCKPIAHFGKKLDKMYAKDSAKTCERQRSKAKKGLFE
jgi:hypothetical protein